ncbi:hypothetical protein PB1_15519 [Bacillus methanolicus PB1]|uniref:Uncharacterized protein n=1 Tax=Bacillus methanolicus PB1 TaxID=997296 RepID=I3DXK9_BACMT|nr:hypothetical protein PB1_15519 [Bacillus methanolicus PB1]
MSKIDKRKSALYNSAIGIDENMKKDQVCCSPSECICMEERNSPGLKGIPDEGQQKANPECS